MDIHELVEKVDGLNSPSTARNWIRDIERISGQKFQKVKNVIGYSRNGRKKIGKVYDFTNDDVEDFQYIAELKRTTTLEKAIERAYGSLKQKEYRNTQKEIEGLRTQNRAVLDDNKLLFEEYRKLNTSYLVLQDRTGRLEQRISELESRFENLPLGFGKKAKIKFGK